MRKKLTNEEVWLQAYCTILRNEKIIHSGVTSISDEATNVADKCLKAFKLRFNFVNTFPECTLPPPPPSLLNKEE